MEIITQCPECWSSNTAVLSVSSDLMRAKLKCYNCDAEFVSYNYNNKKNNDKESNMKCEEVDHPKHYQNGLKTEVECIMFTRNLSFDLGNAFKYVWRAGMKDDITQDIQKALWYLDDASVYNISAGAPELEDFLPKSSLEWWKYVALRFILRGEARQAYDVLFEQLKSISSAS